MAKNIIICSDGTGNKGGYGADTNVYKLFNAVDIHDPNQPQITFYSDGVGTGNNKYISALTGAFGVGFENNVIELYEFLARTYEIGDQIYLFGFSRGAATVRAFAGLIEACGLLDIDKCGAVGARNREQIISGMLDEARSAYRKHKGERNPDVQTAADKFKACQAVQDDIHAPGGDLKIKFIGVWDTVSALGVPQDWSWTVNWFFWGLDTVLNKLSPHGYYNYQLNSNVEYVYHAIAIDDERKTFHPKVWTETRSDRPVNIEQVWFAGVHSNVGGGYPKPGVSIVTLDWMMRRARHLGIKFKNNVENEVRSNANVYDKLYNSRDGVAVYYRYSPRNISKLCTRKNGDPRLDGLVKIHKSVFDRINRGSSRYAPGHLPNDYMVVDTPIDNIPVIGAWLPKRKEIDGWVLARKSLYRIFVEVTLGLILFAGWVWIDPSSIVKNYAGNTILFSELVSGFNFFSWRFWALAYQWAAMHIVDILRYILPEFLEPFVIYALIEKPYVAPIIVDVLIAIYFVREFLREKTLQACERSHR